MSEAVDLARGLVGGLGSHRFVVLDGAVGTELSRRGVDVAAALDGTDRHDDYWSGRALLTDPDAVRRLHEDYLRAGADVLTTNSFRVNRPVLRRLGVAESVETLLRRAVELARAARDTLGAPCLVGGSIGPLEACTAPDPKAEAEGLDREHALTVGGLVASGVDLLLPETLSSILEARVLAARCAGVGVPFVISFGLRPSDGRLYSGEDLVEAADSVLPWGPMGILVNHCAVRLVEPSLRRLARALSGTGVWLGARAHLGKPTPANGWRHPGDCSVSQYVDYARRWLEAGARILGGCCGTTPAYIAGLAQLREREAI